jgi:hypothetical protein
MLSDKYGHDLNEIRSDITGAETNDNTSGDLVADVQRVLIDTKIFEDTKINKIPTVRGLDSPIDLVSEINRYCAEKIREYQPALMGLYLYQEY